MISYRFKGEVLLSPWGGNLESETGWGDIERVYSIRSTIIKKSIKRKMACQMRSQGDCSFTIDNGQHPGFALLGTQKMGGGGQIVGTVSRLQLKARLADI